MLKRLTHIFAAFVIILMSWAVSVEEILAEEAADPVEQETAVYTALSMGTGWALTQHHIVTNYHVIDGVRNLRLVTQDQTKIPVNVALVDKKNDLAVLTFIDKEIQLTALPLALTSPRLGSHVFTVGYPHPDLMGTSPKLTSGFINATNGLADDPRTFQISVPVQAGNSGGPLLNMRGEVVGVITSKLSAQKMFEWTGDVPQNVNYAIKVNRLSSLISELEIDEQVLAGGAKSDQSLEELAEKVITSVIIVAGDSDRGHDLSKAHFFDSYQKNIPSTRKEKSKIIVYSFAEPGNYDLFEGIDGSDSVQVYSKNTLNLLKQELVQYLKGNAEFVTESGEVIRKRFYQLETTQFSKALCAKQKADKIIASYSEKLPGGDYRYVIYRLVDCMTLKEFKKQYRIERDEMNDNFGYEVELYTSFKDFLIKVPPYISWQRFK